jgi:hypothetical protein
MILRDSRLFRPCCGDQIADEVTPPLGFSCSTPEFWTAKLSHPVENVDADFGFCFLIAEVPRFEFWPDHGGLVARTAGLLISGECFCS